MQKIGIPLICLFIAGNIFGKSVGGHITFADTAGVVNGQSSWSENIASIMQSGFADSSLFVTATGVDTGFFNIGFPYQKSGALQKLDSLNIVWWATVNTDSIIRVALDTVSTIGVAYGVDSFVTAIGNSTAETKVFTAYNILDKVYQLRVLTRGTGEIKLSKIKYFISNR